MLSSIRGVGRGRGGAWGLVAVLLIGACGLAEPAELPQLDGVHIGARIELTQIDPDAHEGTPDDPYPVRWLADGRCLR